MVLLDLIMPHLRGEEILERISELTPELPVIVVTAEQDVRSAVRCMRLGAVDYLVKPVDGDQLVAAVERTLEQSALQWENRRLREQFFTDQLQNPEAFADIVTADPAMRRLFGYLEAISRGSQPVLVTGETGTGKELVARALHRVSGRDGPFVAVDVAGLDDAVFADTLFGHRRGAFTGAEGARAGRIERAGEGTLFLDEIGDLSAASQVKLLRLVQEREYYPLGTDRPRRLRARVVAATHRDPAALRRDLYYRLRSYRVRLPTLRQRPGDLPLLVDHFLAAAAKDLGKGRPEVSPELFGRLAGHRFPGNVRELQAMVFDAVARHRAGPLPLEPFLEPLAGEPEAGPAAAIAAPATGRILTQEEWRRLERQNLTAALRQAGGKVSGPGGAAELLGMKPTTLASRLKALRIERR